MQSADGFDAGAKAHLFKALNAALKSRSSTGSDYSNTKTALDQQLASQIRIPHLTNVASLVDCQVGGVIVTKP
jgi:hypothetical protein